MAASALRETRNEMKKDAGNETPKKNAKLAAAAVLLLLAGAAADYWLGRAGMRLPGTAFAGAAARSHPGGASGAQLADVALDPFLVNLAGGQGYLKLSITLAIGPNPAERSSSALRTLARSALVRDTIVQTLSSQNADALLTAEGRSALKKVLAAALRAAAPGLPLERIYFTDFLVQR